MGTAYRAVVHKTGGVRLCKPQKIKTAGKKLLYTGNAAAVFSYYPAA